MGSRTWTTITKMQASVYHIAVTLFGLVQYSKVILSIEISANTDQDFEEIPCETEMSEEWSMPLLRNGLGDDSYFIWADKKIPFVIGDGFGKNETDNIKDAVANYNDIFKGCLEWVEKTDQDVYVEFLNSGSCYSRVGRAYWPFPLPQSIFIGRCAHLVGHIKHEMMHTLGFYHEHSRSDRDQYIKVNWDHISDGNEAQFLTYRWTTGFGEHYDYDSIMHYSSKAFSKDPESDDMLTIEPISTDRNLIPGLGRRRNLSDTDVKKIKKMYKCSPYENWDNGCSSDGDCGLNEHCAISITVLQQKGQCRTNLRDGSFCARQEECLSQICSGGVCTSCTQDGHCAEGQYCSNKYLPLVEKTCTNFCGELCILSATCGGSCPNCGWGLSCY